MTTLWKILYIRLCNAYYQRGGVECISKPSARPCSCTVLSFLRSILVHHHRHCSSHTNPLFSRFALVFGCVRDMHTSQNDCLWHAFSTGSQRRRKGHGTQDGSAGSPAGAATQESCAPPALGPLCDYAIILQAKGPADLRRDRPSGYNQVGPGPLPLARLDRYLLLHLQGDKKLRKGENQAIGQPKVAV